MKKSQSLSDGQLLNNYRNVKNESLKRCINKIHDEESISIKLEMKPTCGCLINKGVINHNSKVLAKSYNSTRASDYHIIPCSWMNHPELQKTVLWSLVIPGFSSPSYQKTDSHDIGTISSANPPIYNLLSLGVRYVNFIVHRAQRNFKSCEIVTAIAGETGKKEWFKLSTLLKEIRRFLDNHRSEVVFLGFAQDQSPKRGTYPSLVDVNDMDHMTLKIFDGTILAKQALEKNTTLRDLNKTQTQLIYFFAGYERVLQPDNAIPRSPTTPQRRASFDSSSRMNLRSVSSVLSTSKVNNGLPSLLIDPDSLMKDWSNKLTEIVKKKMKKMNFGPDDIPQLDSGIMSPPMWCAYNDTLTKPGRTNSKTMISSRLLETHHEEGGVQDGYGSGRVSHTKDYLKYFENALEHRLVKYEKRIEPVISGSSADDLGMRFSGSLTEQLEFGEIPKIKSFPPPVSADELQLVKSRDEVIFESKAYTSIQTWFNKFRYNADSRMLLCCLPPIPVPAPYDEKSQGSWYNDGTESSISTLTQRKLEHSVPYWNNKAAIASIPPNKKSVMNTTELKRIGYRFHSKSAQEVDGVEFVKLRYLDGHKYCPIWFLDAKTATWGRSECPQSKGGRLNLHASNNVLSSAAADGSEASEVAPSRESIKQDATRFCQRYEGIHCHKLPYFVMTYGHASTLVTPTLSPKKMPAEGKLRRTFTTLLRKEKTLSSTTTNGSNTSSKEDKTTNCTSSIIAEWICCLFQNPNQVDHSCRFDSSECPFNINAAGIAGIVLDWIDEHAIIFMVQFNLSKKIHLRDRSNPVIDTKLRVKWDQV